MARGVLAQTREQRLTLLDGLTTGKQAPSANALEVVARGLVLAGQAGQGFGRGEFNSWVSLLTFCLVDSEA